MLYDDVYLELGKHEICLQDYLNISFLSWIFLNYLTTKRSRHFDLINIFNKNSLQKIVALLKSFKDISFILDIFH